LALEEWGILVEATKSFGARRCLAVLAGWKLSGMKTGLYHHQLIGVRWMLGREFSPSGIKGGLLSDEMGLGKPLQALGCFTQNMPSKKELKAGKGSTLLVVPNKLVHQWESEIRRHCKNDRIRSIHVFRGSKREISWQSMSMHGFVYVRYPI
jgi:SNF2 family DNA or RNA helicase